MSRPTSQFLRLPRKLRDQVYHELWSDTKKLKVEYHGAMFEVAYGHDQTDSQQGNNLWIMANKQILQEAVEQYQRESNWTLEPCYLPKARATQGLLVPWQGYGLVLNNLVANEYFDFRDNTIAARWVLEHPLIRLLRQFAAECGETRPSKVQRLTLPLYFELGNSQGALTVEDVDDVAVDLSSLECLATPTLQNIAMSATLTADVLQNCQKLYPMVCDEMIRIMGILTHARTGRVKNGKDASKGQYSFTWEMCEPPAVAEVKTIGNHGDDF